MITLENVTKQYSSTVQIGPVDLQIPSGGLTALIGPNGAGKSTLLTMIGRLLGLDDGAIAVAGYDVTTTKSKDLAKIVSILRQENHFITRLTVRQLVVEGTKQAPEPRLVYVTTDRRYGTIIPVPDWPYQGQYWDAEGDRLQIRGRVILALMDESD